MTAGTPGPASPEDAPLLEPLLDPEPVLLLELDVPPLLEPELDPLLDPEPLPPAPDPDPDAAPLLPPELDPSLEPLLHAAREGASSAKAHKRAGRTFMERNGEQS